MSKDYFFTSESVTEGHPDKVADQISDAIVDAILAQDKHSRIAAETLVTTGLVILAGEITTDANVDYARVARETIRQIGYADPNLRFDADGCSVHVCYGQQSANIAQGVNAAYDNNLDQGAGDQGLMFGYACDETDSLMPMPIYLSHRLVERQAMLRKDGRLSWLRPDAKSQVTVRYVDGKPDSIDTVVLSTQHHPDMAEGPAGKRRMKQAAIDAIIEDIIQPVLPKELIKGDIKYLVNPTGVFEIGGPHGDAGLTGRKIIVDTYGGAAPHGGGAFSGKDPTKVDRSAAYAARYLAKNVVAAGLAERCTIQLAYAIGVSQPLAVYCDLHGTGNVDEAKIEKAAREVMSLSPRGIREHLGLNKPIYAHTSAYGHFGRKPSEDGGFSWEKTDLVAALKTAVGV